jgi:ABC-type glycerol-3-phosphate transport system permease component
MSDSTTAAAADPRRTPRILGTIIAVIGILLAVAGTVTYFTVSSTLKAERITTSKDACLPDRPVSGPFTAYCEAMIIAHHADEATGGKTYAELAKDDPLRQTAMTASFLRASLFTSVVAFGVAALAVLLGVMFVLVGVALRMMARE